MTLHDGCRNSLLVVVLMMSVVLPVTDYPKLSPTNLCCTCAHNAGETYARMVKPKCFECTTSIAREDKTLPVFHSCVRFFRIIFLKCKNITHQRLYFFFQKKPPQHSPVHCNSHNIRVRKGEHKLFACFADENIFNNVVFVRT